MIEDMFQKKEKKKYLFKLLWIKNTKNAVENTVFVPLKDKLRLPVCSGSGRGKGAGLLCVNGSTHKLEVNLWWTTANPRKKTILAKNLWSGSW